MPFLLITGESKRAFTMTYVDKALFEDNLGDDFVAFDCYYTAVINIIALPADILLWSIVMHVKHREGFSDLSSYLIVNPSFIFCILTSSFSYLSLFAATTPLSLRATSSNPSKRRCSSKLIARLERPVSCWLD